jgi:hypothetical protein
MQHFEIERDRDLELLEVGGEKLWIRSQEKNYMVNNFL